MIGFLYLPIMNEKGQFLVSRIYTSVEHYTILYEMARRSTPWPTIEDYLFNFVLRRTHLVADQLIYIGSRNIDDETSLFYIAFCPFDSTKILSSRCDEELKWVDLKEMPGLLHKEDLFMVDILQKFCLQTDLGIQLVSRTLN